jgi:hypothetical protein
MRIARTVIEAEPVASQLCFCSDLLEGAAALAEHAFSDLNADCQLVPRQMAKSRPITASLSLLRTDAFTSARPRAAANGSNNTGLLT